MTDVRVPRGRELFTQRCAQNPKTGVIEVDVTGSPKTVRLLINRHAGVGNASEQKIVTMTPVDGDTWQWTLGPYAQGEGDLTLTVQAYNDIDHMQVKDVSVAITDCPPLTGPQ